MSQKSSNDCPFCPPEVDKATFAEGSRFRAIYNIAPILPGHSLIVPKEHKQSVLDLNDSEACEFVTFARTLTRFLETVFKSNGINWTIQDGESAGQTVSHLHLHLIPRSTRDLAHPGDWYPLLKQAVSRHIDDAERSKLTEQQMAIVVEELRVKWAAFSANAI